MPIQQNISRKRFLRVLMIVAGVLLIITGIANIWLAGNAKDILKNIVHSSSKGKLQLELTKVSFNLLSGRIQIREGALISTDSLSEPSTYNVKFRKVTIRVHSFWPLILENKLLLDSIKLHDPEIKVTQWRKDTARRADKEDLSIAQEMGRVYNSMIEGLDVVGIKRVIINNASFSLINKMKPGSAPVTVSKIYFNLLQKKPSERGKDDTLTNKQSVVLTTSMQDIALPGGRHRLAFKTFNLQLFRQRIQLDSCTITAIAKDSSKSSYVVFFDKLFLVGVDFGAMYHSDLLRVDSVYCLSPLFNIDLFRGDALSRKKEKPDIERIVKELAGDLDLGFVGVKNAGIKIGISGNNKNRSLSNNHKDNFEIRGLRLNSDSSVPVSVKSFDMVVRDYRLFNSDSSVAYSFDSIRFANRKIILNNFTLVTAPKHSNEHNQRRIRIPAFQLTGLDWYELIFEQNLKAKEAVLINPVITFSKTKTSGPRKKTNLFAALQNLDSLLTLGKVDIVNGQIDMEFGPTTSFSLQNVNVKLNSNKLLESENKEGLRRAVDLLDFSKGVLRLKDLTVELNNVKSSGSNLIYAENLAVSNVTSELNASLRGVYINNMLIDDHADTIVMDGLQWESAVFAMRSLPVLKSGKRKPGQKNRAESIHIKNISGANSLFKFSDGNLTVSTFLNSIKAASLSKNGKSPLKTEELLISGSDLLVNNPTMKLKASSYQLSQQSGEPSFLSRVSIENIAKGDTLSIFSSRINFSADVNALLANDLHIASADVVSPVIKFSKRSVAKPSLQEKPKKISISIDKMTATGPELNITTYIRDSVTIVRMPQSDKNMLKASGIKINGDNIDIGSVSMKTTSAIIIKPGGEMMGVDKGKVDLQLSDLHLSKKAGLPVWSAVVNSLHMDHPKTMTVGKNKNKLDLEQVTIGNLNLSSAYMTDFNQLVKYNVSAWLRTTTGRYSDSITTLKWFNAAYDNSRNTLSLDSFVYHPTQSRDYVISHTPHQTDYITFRSGKIALKGFDPDKFRLDSSFIVKAINISNPVITVYRDKRPPFNGGNIKHLPVDLIRKIPFPFSVENVTIKDGWLSYTETNAKSGAEGTLFLTAMNGGISNLRNRDLRQDDSLHIKATSLLMGTSLLNMSVDQSYSDTLSGFLMRLSLMPTSLQFLNPVVTPLANVKITSGTLTSLNLSASCNEYFAFGEMEMFYHNLHIKLVKAGDPEKTPFISDMMSILANKLVIKTNNRSRTGVVYFDRLRDRSFFNYIVKTTLSGMASSTGVARNRRYNHQYKNAIKVKDPQANKDQ